MKRNITKSILQMSLDHHIVTPFTAMLIENEEKDEIMLADQPKDPRRGCCPGQCLSLSITTLYFGFVLVMEEQLSKFFTLGGCVYSITES